MQEVACPVDNLPCNCGDICPNCDARPAKTGAERQSNHRNNKRAAGLVPMEIWTKPEHKQAIKQLASDLNDG